MFSRCVLEKFFERYTQSDVWFDREAFRREEPLTFLPRPPFPELTEMPQDDANTLTTMEVDYASRAPGSASHDRFARGRPLHASNNTGVLQPPPGLDRTNNAMTLTALLQTMNRRQWHSSSRH